MLSQPAHNVHYSVWRTSRIILMTSTDAQTERAISHFSTSVTETVCGVGRVLCCLSFVTMRLVVLLAWSLFRHPRLISAFHFDVRCIPVHLNTFCC